MAVTKGQRPKARPQLVPTLTNVSSATDRAVVAQSEAIARLEKSKPNIIDEVLALGDLR